MATGGRPRSVTPGLGLGPGWAAGSGLRGTGARACGVWWQSQKAWSCREAGLPWQSPGMPQGTHWEPLPGAPRSWSRLGTFWRGGPSPRAPWAPSLPSPAALLSGEEGRGPGCLGWLLHQKREKLRASPAPPWQRANLPASFPPPYPASSLKGAGSLACGWGGRETLLAGAGVRGCPPTSEMSVA